MKEVFHLKTDLNTADLSKTCSENRVVRAISLLGSSGTNDLSFCDDAEMLTQPASQRSIIIISPELEPKLTKLYPSACAVITQDARAFFIDLTHALVSKGEVDISSLVPRPFGIHPSAQIGAHVTIDPYARVDEHVVIEDHCVIKRGTWIKSNTIIRANTVIGEDGITRYRGLDNKDRYFPHLGSVILGKNCQVGANSVLVRGILGSTVIGDNTIIGNQCNVGHGVHIGNMVWMSVGCCIGGHSQIGNKTCLGMGVSVRDNLTIGEHVNVGMGSVVTKSINDRTSVFGNPARRVRAIKTGPN